MTATLNDAIEASRPRIEVTAGPARRTLGTLRSERGFVVLSGTDAAPEIVRIRPWVEVTTWKRVTRTGGDQALYERTDAPNPVLIIDMDGEYLAGGGR